MRNKKTAIDLEQYLEVDSRVLNGRKWGSELCNKLNLAELYAHSESIEINIPKRIISMGTTFFLGLFGELIRDIGEVNFSKTITFNDSHLLSDDIQTGIRYAVTRFKAFELYSI